MATGSTGSTGYLTVVPDYVEPDPEPYSAVVQGVRWLCLLILLASLVLVVLSRSTREATNAELFHDLQTGRASSVTVQALGSSSSAATAEVRWETGVLHWYQTTVSNPEPGGTVDDLLHATARQGGHYVQTSEYQSHRVIFFDVTGLHVWGPLVFATGIVWLWTFLTMLFIRDHSYANRWAWFWLFVIGGVGPLLLLWKEPEPLRLRFWRDREPYRWNQTPLTGGIGLVYAIGCAIALTVAGALLRWAVSR